MYQRTFIGMDVHARSVKICAITPETGEVQRASLAMDHHGVRDWIVAHGGEISTLRAVYEAGPTGYGLARTLTAAGIQCVVAAPSRLIRPSGDRVKTDARDAEHLARLLSLGQVTEVRVPGPEEEAARDLVRLREDARMDLMRSRHRLSKLLLRHDLLYTGGKAWSADHRVWLEAISFEIPALQMTLYESIEMVDTVIERRDRLDAQIELMATTSSYAPVVTALECLRGVGTLTAFGLAVEIGDWTRFTGNSIGAYLGLVPSEHSSGQTRSQGPVTKTGNKHARRLLVEAAWHHARPYDESSATLRRRWDAATPETRAHAHRANQRLHRRWQAFEERKKRRCVANVAIARELAGWCWALAEPQQRHGQDTIIGS
ncbi:IS110 family transposase [Glutamicibacter creatinolyticus]|uniref:IS110 family transposase n=1 Tax=Glutamicibacter creatinolyticus TaxID=162496 RepID=UPI0037BF587E